MISHFAINVRNDFKILYPSSIQSRKLFAAEEAVTPVCLFEVTTQLDQNSYLFWIRVAHRFAMLLADSDYDIESTFGVIANAGSNDIDSMISYLARCTKPNEMNLKRSAPRSRKQCTLCTTSISESGSSERVAWRRAINWKLRSVAAYYTYNRPTPDRMLSHRTNDFSSGGQEKCVYETWSYGSVVFI